MGRMPGAMPKTIAATDRARRRVYRPDDRDGAARLMLVLAMAECDFAVGGAVRRAVLGELISLTATLAGRSWLRVHAYSPEVAAFKAARAATPPPSLAELDHILAAMLLARFGPAAKPAGRPGMTTDHTLSAAPAALSATDR